MKKLQNYHRYYLNFITKTNYLARLMALSVQPLNGQSLSKEALFMLRKSFSFLCGVAFLLSVQAQALSCSEQVLAAKADKTAGTPVQIDKAQAEKLQQEKTEALKKKGAGLGTLVMGIALVGIGMLTGGVGAIILVSVGAGMSTGGSLYLAKTKDIGQSFEAQILTEITTPVLYQQSKDYIDARKKDPKVEMGDELLAFKAGVKNKDVLSFGVAEAVIQLIDKNEKNAICDGDKIATPREILDGLNNEKTSLQPVSGS